MRRVLDFVQNGLFHSLASRVIGFVFAATLMTSLVVTWVSSQSIRTFLRANLEQEFTAALMGSAQRLDVWLDQRRQDIVSFAGSQMMGRNIELIVKGTRGARGENARKQVHGYLTSVLERAPLVFVPSYEPLPLGPPPRTARGQGRPGRSHLDD